MGFTRVFFLFCHDKSPFCGATGTPCFALWLTLPTSFKAKVDIPSPVLCSYLCIMILRVNSESNAYLVQGSYLVQRYCYVAGISCVASDFVVLNLCGALPYVRALNI